MRANIFFHLISIFVTTTSYAAGPTVEYFTDGSRRYKFLGTELKYEVPADTSSSFSYFSHDELGAALSSCSPIESCGEDYAKFSRYTQGQISSIGEQAAIAVADRVKSYLPNASKPGPFKVSTKDVYIPAKSIVRVKIDYVVSAGKIAFHLPDQAKVLLTPVFVPKIKLETFETANTPSVTSRLAKETIPPRIADLDLTKLVDFMNGANDRIYGYEFTPERFMSPIYEGKVESKSRLTVIIDTKAYGVWLDIYSIEITASPEPIPL